MAAMPDISCMLYAWKRSRDQPRYLRMCGRPHAASLQIVGLDILCQRILQVAGPVVLDFAVVWAATHGFLASCRSGCPGSRGGV